MTNVRDWLATQPVGKWFTLEEVVLAIYPKAPNPKSDQQLEVVRENDIHWQRVQTQLDELKELGELEFNEQFRLITGELAQ